MFFRVSYVGLFWQEKFTYFKIGCVFYFRTAIKMTVLFSIVEFGIQHGERLASACVQP